MMSVFFHHDGPRPSTWFAVALLPLALACGDGATSNGTHMPSINTPITLPEIDTPLLLEPGQAAARHFDVHGEEAMFLQVVVEQQGLDVTVRLFDPEDTEVKTVDSPIGDRGEEELVAILDRQGRYRVEVQGGEGAAGDVVLRGQTLRPLTDDDRLLVASDQAHRDGWRLFRKEFERARDERGFDATLAAYQQALDGWTTLLLPSREAETLGSLAAVYEETRDYDAAITLLDRAIDLLAGSTSSRHHILLALFRDAGGTLRRQRLQQPDRAIDDYFLPALEIGRRLLRPKLLASIYDRLGRAYHDIGAFQDALDAYAKAFELATKPADRFDVLVHRSSTLLALFAFEETLAASEMALAEAQELRPIDRARATMMIAQGQARLGQLGEAEHQARAALLVMREHGTAHHLNALTALGDIHRRQGRLIEARKIFEEIVRLAQVAGDANRESIGLVELANVVRLAKQPEAALTLCNQSAAIAMRRNDVRRLASAHARAAEALRDLDELEEATSRIDNALDHVDALRAVTVRHNLRSGFYAFRQEYFDIALSIAIARWSDDRTASNAAAALQVHERRLARELHDALVVRGDTDSDAPMGQAERTLEGELSRLLLTPDDNAPKQRAAIDAVIAQLQDLRGAHRRGDPPKHLQTPPSLTEVAATLDTETRLVVFALGPDESYRWTLDSRGPEAMELVVLPHGRDELQATARNWRSMLTSARASDRAQAREGGPRLARSLAFVPGSPAPKRLILIADGALAELPFSALSTEDGAWVDTTEVVLVPSMSALLSLRAQSNRRPSSVRPALIVSDPVFDRDDDRLRGRTRGLAIEPTPRASGPRNTTGLQRALERLDQRSLPRLPATAVEAEALMTHIPVTGSWHLSGLAAHRAAFEAHLRAGVSVLHLATHAIANVDRPDLSGIVLSMLDADGNELNGFIRASELVAMGIDADLVVLSGCNTATGRLVRGEGMVGLARRVLDAGATRVIASLWAVSDAPTADLMSRFYDGLWRQGLPPARALRAAQEALAMEQADPHYWAGFVFLGDWRRPTGW